MQKNKKQIMKDGEVRATEKFNNATNSLSVENQNQTYNIKKEALGPNAKR